MSEAMIMRPPMVGVPALAAWAFTSERMYWPHLMRCRKLMNQGPKITMSTMAVMRAPMERKVM